LEIELPVVAQQTCFCLEGFQKGGVKPCKGKWLILCIHEC